MKLIVLSAFCVIAFTTFSEVAGFDSAEKEDVSEIQNGTYSSGELKDIDYDLDTTRGPVDPSNPPTAPTPAGPGIEPHEEDEEQKQPKSLFYKIYHFLRYNAVVFLYMYAALVFVLVTKDMRKGSLPTTYKRDPF
ncbi:uncharacterized protein LOC124358030 isoform X7 [Homalodisca vitripennis]|uniref:uncharacterized protein LOC124358030 isoform X7 n=1 Tax=Homalodisca vitripennis TaxID=197043 RepID=UPI001EE9E780|nr:uncharacterized protein LOC124358030 isoform X7 [Homalodisca vitripennis]XP_046666249.1 uncharacterized protein LOC124358030 isoform X7 [Homalodisca vitripennis]